MDPRPTHTLPSVTLREWERADLACLLGPLRGRRAIIVNAAGSHHGYRVWSEPMKDRSATILWVVSEEAWWRHKHLAMSPELIRWPAAAAWIEQE